MNELRRMLHRLIGATEVYCIIEYFRSPQHYIPRYADKLDNLVLDAKAAVDTPVTIDFQKRFCLECKFFYLSFGTEDWSEVTPGSPPEIVCCRRHFNETIHEVGADNMPLFRELIRTARTCEEFELLEDK